MTGFNLHRHWDARFRAFAARKEREARDARLSPFTTEIDASPTGLTGLLSIGDAWSRRLWDGPFQLSPARSVDLPAVSLVFVQSLDGNTGAADPATPGGDPHTPMCPRPLDARLVTRKHGTGDASGVVFDYLTLISNSLGQSLPVTNSRS